MSKHNNNLNPSASRKCNCGRRITIGEEKAGVGVFSYECPDCLHARQSKPLTREQYYKQFGLQTKTQ